MHGANCGGECFEGECRESKCFSVHDEDPVLDFAWDHAVLDDDAEEVAECVDVLFLAELLQVDQFQVHDDHWPALEVPPAGIDDPFRQKCQIHISRLVVEGSLSPLQVRFQVLDEILGFELGHVDDPETIAFLPVRRQFDLVLLDFLIEELEFLTLVIVVGHCLPDFALALGPLVFLDVRRFMLHGCN